MFGRKKGNSPKVPSKEKLEYIKALGEGGAKNKKKKKQKQEDGDANFNRLLQFVSDPDPECRIAAAEMLGKTSRDVAFTHISHYFATEKDERVAAAMKKAMLSIRENMKREHAEKN